MQMLIKLVLAGIWLVLVPTAAGALLAKRKKITHWEKVS